jgi:3-(3-hydroxy-phenyl)propionate hydroxylase
LVQRGRERRSLTGRLCPNAPTPAGGRFDSQAGTGFNLVTAIRPTPEQTSLIERRHAVVHYAEPGSALADWLAAGSASAAVVRPDFTVLRSGRDLSALCAALPGLG